MQRTPLYQPAGWGRNTHTNVIDEEATVAPVAALPAIFATANLFWIACPA